MIAGGRQTTVNVMLDTGSSLTLLRRRVASALGLSGPAKKLRLAVAGGTVLRESEEMIVTFQLMSLSQRYVTPPMDGTTTQKVASSLDPVKLDPKQCGPVGSFEFTFRYPQKGRIPVDVILSSGWSIALQFGEILQTQADIGPRVIHTRLGPVLSGSYLVDVHPSKVFRTHVAGTTADADPFDLTQLKDFMKLEQLGVVETDSHYTVAELEAISAFESSLTYDPVYQEYTVGLLWRKDRDPATHLDSNVSRALAVCRAFKRKSMSDPNKEALINAAYREQTDLKMATIVPRQDWEPQRPTYTLPTHPVYKQSSKSTPIRIVQNASSVCATTGYSLNDCLHIGPNLLPDIAKLMLKFRQCAYVTTLDISKMYWRVRIAEKDQPFLRYVWQFERQSEPIMMQSSVVTFGVNDSPYKSIATVHTHCRTFQAEFPLGSAALLETLYMDDASGMHDDRQQLACTARQMYDLLNSASMPTHKWNCNDPNVLNLAGIPAPARSLDPEQKFLGMRWNSREDTIQFCFKDILHQADGRATKRSLISELAAVYDPLGIVSPWVLKGKALFQQTWKVKDMEWDSLLPDDIAKEWEEWREEAKRMITISLPRLCADPKENKWLAVFSDASLKGMAACCYVVGETTSRLVFAKTKATPIHSSDKEKANPSLSIARLELISAVIGARLGKYVQDSFPTDYFYKARYFTDSLISYYRIRRGHMHYKTWVSNRVKEITETSGADNFRFIPGAINPSDLGSRGCSMEELKANLLWFNGPKFILEPEDQWPVKRALSRQEALDLMGDQFSQAEVDEETSAPAPPGIAAANAARAQQQTSLSWHSRFSDHYSTWGRLIRATAYLFRLVYHCLKRSLTGRKLTRLFSNWERAIDEPLLVSQRRSELSQFETQRLQSCSFLTIKELKRAEFYWIRRLQFESYPDVFADPENASKYYRLRGLIPFFDENGLLRANTRLRQSATMPASSIQPVILPKHSRLVELLVRDLHEKEGHLAKQSTFHLLRRRYLLQGGKHELNRILYKCPNKACNPPRMMQQQWAPLPQSRVDNFTPYDIVMVDFAGPFDVVIKWKEGADWKSQTRKGYACLFTCFYSRAVAIELTEDLTTQSFINAFIRACARNGRPRIVYSDNATTLRAADKYLRHLFARLNWREVGAAAAQRGIEWRFGIQLSPHSQGACERMIKSLKLTIKRNFSLQKMTPMQLQTAFCDCEAWINDRPIAPPQSAIDSELVITPSLLTRGRLLTQVPQDPSHLDEEGISLITRMMVHRRLLQNKLWRAWQNEYLLQFQVTRLLASKNMPRLEVGQVVLLRDKNLRLGTWKLVRVMELCKGTDGLVRRVILKTSTGTLNRHVNDLAFMEGMLPTTALTDGQNDPNGSQRSETPIERTDRTPAGGDTSSNGPPPSGGPMTRSRARAANRR